MHIIIIIKRVKSALLLMGLLFVLFLFTSCVTGNSDSKCKVTSDDYSFNICEDDINNCIKMTLDNYDEEDYKGIEPIICNEIYDINNDYEKEILILSSVIRNELFIYKKQPDGTINQIGRCGYGKLDYVTDLHLYTYVKDSESFPFFIFHYDNGGVMSCDVISSIEKVKNNYEINYKLSWGTNTYELNNENKVVEFYSLGWDKTDIAIDDNQNYLTQSEFDTVFINYKLAMQK